MSTLINASKDLTKEQQALASQFSTLSLRVNESDSLVTINDTLRSSTYLLGNELNKVDLTLFDSILPTIKSFKPEDFVNYRHVVRWGDLIQNLTDHKDKFEVNKDLELPREIKEKKKKEDAPKAAPVASTKPEAPKKQDADQKDNKKEVTEEEKKAKADAKKAAKAAKAKANAEKAAAEKAAQKPPSPSLIDFRVGFIQKAIKHPNADSLYVSTIDVGEEEPRTICSGLVKYIPLEQMQQRFVIVVANLKPVAMRGIKSNGMVLCASNPTEVEFPGDKLFFEDFNGTPEKQLNPKKKIFETCQPLFSTTENFEVTYTEEGQEPKKLVNERGELCKNSTLVKAEVK
ncbi:nucleic acid-binding protein [Yamadazyma tenuis ATCC 10573]|uniref:Nucleic acid-binding protein n=1 Tax=Candida tenuis (strain ATCC 10573 / BCRC 21748 / CBS 615 / JCM 9827 / NBRC 10315 / NRRL Y-1498 / VKM Y-70) TaxID=590646 RepID=G3B792_CANTC|nr:nucleic acid-binding protein [Yamadazyma tenuis ATCC 10573]EGV61598.1 nucleic acid-binding protein [Yamadazyma tenuis ATCC 10573]